MDNGSPGMASRYTAARAPSTCTADRSDRYTGRLPVSTRPSQPLPRSHANHRATVRRSRPVRSARSSQPGDVVPSPQAANASPAATATALRRASDRSCSTSEDRVNVFSGQRRGRRRRRRPGWYSGGDTGARPIRVVRARHQGMEELARRVPARRARQSQGGQARVGSAR